MVDQDRARVVLRAGPVGPADRRARRGRAEARVHRGERVRPRGDARRRQPPRRRQVRRHPDGGRDRQAVRLRDGVEGARRADPGPRGPRLRNRRVAQGAWREAGACRAGAARHADQPDLRGLDGDHAPADRARGGRPAPENRGRSARAGRRAQRPARIRRQGRAVLLQVAAAARGRQGAGAELLRRFGELAPAICGSWSGPRASWRARRSTG